MRIKVILFSMLFCCTQAWAQSWSLLRDSALVFKNAGNIDAALPLFEESLQMLPADSNSSASKLFLLKETGSAYYKKSVFSKALPFYEQANALNAILYGPQSNAYSETIFVTGQLYYLLKQYQQAETSYLQARSNWEKLNSRNSKTYADVCNAMGVLYNDWQRFDEALAIHAEARSIREALYSSKHPAYAQSCNNLAAIYWSLGQLDKAEPLALEAKTLRQQLPEVPRPAYAISCVNLANIYRDMGKFEAAEQLYLEAKDIRGTAFGTSHELYIQTCEISAGLYSYMNQWKQAEELLLEAKSLREKKDGATGFYYAQCCSNLARLYLNTQKPDSAETLALRSLEIFTQIGEPALADKAITENLLGSIYFEKKNNSQALSYLLNARNYWKQSLGTQHPFYNANTLAIARVYKVRNQSALAESFYWQAFESEQAQLANVFSFTAEVEKKLYVDNVNANTDEYLSFYFDKMRSNNKGVPFNLLLNSNNSILSSIHQLRNFVYASKDSVLRNMFSEWLQMKKQLASLYYSSDVSLKNYTRAKTASADQLEKNIFSKAAAQGYSKQKQVLNWKNIQSSLQPKEAVIAFFDFTYFNGYRYTDSTWYAAFLIKPGSKEPQWIQLLQQNKLDSLFKKRQAKSMAGKRGVIKLSNSLQYDQLLYSWIWGPLTPFLKDIRTLYVSPTGLLNNVSFAGLPLDSVRYLSDVYQLQQSGSAASTIAYQSKFKTKGEKMVLFGGIDYNAATTGGAIIDSIKPMEILFDFLPGTAVEIDGIQKLSKRNISDVTVISGAAATEAAFKNLGGMQSPGIIHVASHGFYISKNNFAEDSLGIYKSVLEKTFDGLKDPMLRCGLAFAGANYFANSVAAANAGEDGILTAYEIANMQLSATNLVVLSACETALGDIEGSEGVYGLQRAFKMAGVQNIIMSLWEVPDMETAVFMKELYANLFDGLPVDKAFYATQASLRNRYRSQPNKWAAWVLYR